MTTPAGIYVQAAVQVLRGTATHCACGGRLCLTFIPDESGTWTYDPATKVFINDESGRTIQPVWVCGDCVREYAE